MSRASAQASRPENPWVVRRRSGLEPRSRLICFPYAGGGSVIFHPWSKAFPADIEVCAIEAPGRYARCTEPLITSMPGMVAALDAATIDLLDRPYALFGYSLGGLIAFEFARARRRRSAPPPSVLIVAACTAPQLMKNQRASFSRLPEARFMQEVETRYGPLDPLIKNEPEMLRRVLDVMRADMRIIDDYEFRSEPPLDCPLAVVGGNEDVTVDPANLSAWSEHTRAPFQSKVLPGGHFFLRTQGNELRQFVLSAIRAA